MRRASVIFAAACLALALLTAAVWARSLWRLDQVQWDADPRALDTAEEEAFVAAGQYDVRTSAGGLMVFWGDVVCPTKAYRHPTGQTLSWIVEECPEYPQRPPRAAQQVLLHRGGFQIVTEQAGNLISFRRTTYVTVPLWFVTLLFAAPATAIVQREWRHRTLPGPGHCVRCGYDLRASVGRCPECGTPSASARHR